MDRDNLKSTAYGKWEAIPVNKDEVEQEVLTNDNLFENLESPEAVAASLESGIDTNSSTEPPIENDVLSIILSDIRELKSDIAQLKLSQYHIPDVHNPLSVVPHETEITDISEIDLDSLSLSQPERFADAEIDIPVDSLDAEHTAYQPSTDFSVSLDNPSTLDVIDTPNHIDTDMVEPELIASELNPAPPVEEIKEFLSKPIEHSDLLSLQEAEIHGILPVGPTFDKDLDITPLDTDNQDLDITPLDNDVNLFDPSSVIDIEQQETDNVTPSDNIDIHLADENVNLDETILADDNKVISIDTHEEFEITDIQDGINVLDTTEDLQDTIPFIEISDNMDTSPEDQQTLSLDSLMMQSENTDHDSQSEISPQTIEVKVSELSAFINYFADILPQLPLEHQTQFKNSSTFIAYENLRSQLDVLSLQTLTTNLLDNAIFSDEIELVQANGRIEAYKQKVMAEGRVPFILELTTVTLIDEIVRLSEDTVDVENADRQWVDFLYDFINNDGFVIPEKNHVIIISSRSLNIAQDDFLQQLILQASDMFGVSANNELFEPFFMPLDSKLIVKLEHMLTTL
jgi:hypothetical protein